ATGDPVCFIDDDTDVPPEWLPAMVQGFERYPGADAYAGRVRVRVEKRGWKPCPQHPLAATLNAGTADRTLLTAVGANMAVRRSAVDKVGVFDDWIVGAEDTEWFDRLRHAGGTVVVRDGGEGAVPGGARRRGTTGRLRIRTPPAAPGRATPAQRMGDPAGADLDGRFPLVGDAAVDRALGAPGVAVLVARHEACATTADTLRRPERTQPGVTRDASATAWRRVPRALARTGRGRVAARLFGIPGARLAARATDHRGAGAAWRGGLRTPADAARDAEARHARCAARRAARRGAPAAAGHSGGVRARVVPVAAPVTAERHDAGVASAAAGVDVGADQPRRAAILATRRQAGLARALAGGSVGADLVRRTTSLAARCQSGLTVDLSVAAERLQHRGSSCRGHRRAHHLQNAAPRRSACQRSRHLLEVLAHLVSSLRAAPQRLAKP